MKTGLNKSGLFFFSACKIKLPPAAFLFFAIGAALFSSLLAELPPELPGEELSQEYMNWAVPKDTSKKPENTAVLGSGMPWIDKAQKTWDAPTMAEQLSADESFVPMGKGGVFVPRFSALQNEPDINVVDANQKPVVSGPPGHSYSVEPGVYSVVVGSGGRNQRMVRKVTVEEGKTVPVLPDWAGLIIDIVDSIAVPFRGEYELVRIDEFEPFGRGFGANPDLGEVVKTWILKPGVYKILGVGQGYNSLINFITIRLMPGELTKLLLVQSRTDSKILGGGIVEVAPRTELSSHWKYGADLGGNLKFYQENSLENTAGQQKPATTFFGLMSILWLNYQKQPYEWQTRVRLDEGFSLAGEKIKSLITDNDDFLLNSLFIWRILPWFGPYGSAEINTTLLPRKAVRENNYDYFCTLTRDSLINPPACFNSSNTYQVQPSFSPLSLNIGAGANADVFKFSFLETKLRAGVGNSYTYVPPQYILADTGKWRSVADSAAYDSLFLQKSQIFLPVSQTNVFELGPQFSIIGMLRLGRVITINSELKIFAPVAPKMRYLTPDFDLRTDVSWRLLRWMTLDYTYKYFLIQAEDLKLRQNNKSSHGIWLRFSYSSR